MGASFRLSLLFVAFVAAVAGIGTGRAVAGVEYCGATVAALPVGGRGDASPAVYALVFSADNPRAVSGSATLHTDGGYFSVDFKDVPIVAHTEHYRAPWVTFTREHDYSDYVFVKFPKPVTMVASWISNASVANDPASGWDGAVHSCPAYDAATPAKKHAATLAVRTDPTPAPPVANAQTAFLSAQPTAAPASPQCTTPFADATVKKPVAPNWPMGYNIRRNMTTLVRVRISPEGTIDDAAVFLPTGVSVFDDAAVAAARAATYTARRSLCVNVPGDYLYRVQWNAR